LGSGRESVKVRGRGTEEGGRVVGVVDWRKFVRRGMVGEWCGVRVRKARRKVKRRRARMRGVRRRGIERN